MASKELMDQYSECNKRLEEAGKKLQSAESLGKMEMAKDEYMLAAFGMVMIQNHILIEMVETMCKKLGM